MKFSIVIPCYNEGDNIPLLMENFAESMRREDVEIVFVNNGSQDNTQQIFKERITDYPFARVVEVKVNQGYGFGILSGLKQSKGEYIGWTHADLQTDPSDCFKAMTIIEEQSFPKNIYIKGCRRGRSLFDNFFTVGMSCFESAYLGQKLWDINAQPNIFHRSFYESWVSPPHDFSLDLYALYMCQLKGLELIRMSVLFPERIHGTSSWNTGMQSKLKFIKRTVDFSFKLKKKLN